MFKKGIWIAAILVCLLLVGGLLAFAGENNNGYLIDGTISADNKLNVDISIDGMEAYGGYLVLGFDPSKLALSDTSTLTNTVKAAARTEIRHEGLPDTQLYSNQQGFVAFAWTPVDNSLNAKGSAKQVASIAFDLLVEQDQLDADSLTLKYLDLPRNFESPMLIIANVGKSNDPLIGNYEYNKENKLDLAVSFTYPGADVLPADAVDVNIVCQDAEGVILPDMRVSIAGKLFSSDELGEIHTHLSPGIYNYKTNLRGYESVISQIVVEEQDVQVLIEVRTDQQVVDDIAANLGSRIIYGKDDSALSVTSFVTLPADVGSNTTINWQSSDPGIIAPTGAVLRPLQDDAEVVLTATINMGKAKAESELIFNVVAAESEEERGGTESAPPVKDTDDIITEDMVPEIVAENERQQAKNKAKQPTQDSADAESNTTPGQTSAFSDLSDVAWAKEAILTLSDAGIISGTGANTFSPNDSIKRGDYVRLLMLMLKPAADGEAKGFSDVPKDSYYEQQILLAQQTGIAKGNSDGTFQPEQQISRQDMMVMTERALIQLGYLQANADSKNLAAYSDAEQISSYARASMANLIAAEFIEGNNGQLNPLSQTTRAEAAVFLYRIYQAFLSNNAQ